MSKWNEVIHYSDLENQVFEESLYSNKDWRKRCYAPNCTEIPFLLSKQAMKRGNAIIDFDSDVITMFGVEYPMTLTTSHHYAIPIAIKSNLMSELESELTVSDVTLIASAEENKHKIATKLHRQFAHPKPDKLITLLRNAGSDDDELFNVIKGLERSCGECIRYRRSNPRLVVGFPMAQVFNECVAMDLKELRGSGVWILQEMIINQLVRIGISMFGIPGKFLSDNSGEFANQEFIDFAESFGIIVKTTAAESPWSNGLCERHNLVVSEYISKIPEDTDCSLELHYHGL